MSKLDCFHQYLTFWARSSNKHVTKRVPCDEGSSALECLITKRKLEKRPKKLVCPPQRERLDCFNDYLAVWVNVMEDSAGRKRQYLGKRAASFM
jgi:hypothetical protein